MTTDEAITEIQKSYIIGAVAYYGRKTPDPWEAAHEEWSQRLVEETNWDFKGKINEYYLDRILGLLEEYKKTEAARMATPNASEGFFSEHAASKSRSIRSKVCYSCQGRTNLQRKVAQGNPYLVCGACVSLLRLN